MSSSTPSLPPAQMAALGRAQLERLAARPNTTVFETKHTDVQPPWPAERIEAALRTLEARARDEAQPTDDLVYRKACVQDPELDAFERRHPQLFWMATDRKQVQNGQARTIIQGMLALRRQVDDGTLQDGPEADALATRLVMKVLTNA